MIETRALRREFGPLVAVDDVTVAFPKGAVVALVGPNGAGKSTWMRMVAGLLEPTRGAASVGGVDVVSSPRQAQRQLGFLPDVFGLYDTLKVGELLEYFARAYGLSPASVRARIGLVLAKVNLGDKRGAFVGHLSRGMRQRLGVAKSLLHDPAVLLLDEPASGLDPEARHDFQQLMKEVAREGKTLVISSHILTELEEYSTHVAMMSHGAMVAAGPIAEVRQRLAGLRRVRVAVAGDPRLLRARLEGADAVSRLEDETDGVTFVFGGDERALADLVRDLLQAGLVITAFGPADGSIQDAYLSAMRGHGE